MLILANLVPGVSHTSISHLVIQGQQQCQRVQVLIKRKKRGSGDAGTSSGPSVNLRPRGPPPPPVYYGDDIEMSDKMESSDDDVEDPSLNFELSWRNQGVAGGGNDSDDDSAEEEEQQGGQQQQLGRPYIREQLSFLQRAY
jgi:hypothetical protein